MHIISNESSTNAVLHVLCMYKFFFFFSVKPSRTMRSYRSILCATVFGKFKRYQQNWIVENRRKKVLNCSRLLTVIRYFSNEHELPGTENIYQFK